MKRVNLAIVLLASAALAGCDTGVAVNNPGPADTAHLIAYSASSDYPKGVTATDAPMVGSQVPPNRGVIQIVNYSDQPIMPSNIWINQTFVQAANQIPAHGVLQLDETKFYSKTGSRLDNAGGRVERVEIQLGNSLMKVMGPVTNGY